MIRYPISSAELKNNINSLKPRWLKKAKEKTARFRRVRRYDETRGTWRQIKDVYMSLQLGKCAYCERKIEGRIENDIEHYRPKSAVLTWPTESMVERGTPYSFPTGGNDANGYYLLAYNIFNYVASCKSCNSRSLKGNYFPIAGPSRVLYSTVANKLRDESPFLLYPLGDIDEDDPEELITFEGITPIPNPAITNPHKRNRALITIDILELHKRELLLRERANIIAILYMAYERQAGFPNTSPEYEKCREMIEVALSPSSPHTNCARSFYWTLENNMDTAEAYHLAAVQYLRGVR
jgi:5-methylcytosine-specific restriction endonuclease McrA